MEKEREIQGDEITTSNSFIVVVFIIYFFICSTLILFLLSSSKFFFFFASNIRDRVKACVVVYPFSKICWKRDEFIIFPANCLATSANTSGGERKGCVGESVASSKEMGRALKAKPVFYVSAILRFPRNNLKRNGRVSRLNVVARINGDASTKQDFFPPANVCAHVFRRYRGERRIKKTFFVLVQKRVFL